MLEKINKDVGDKVKVINDSIELVLLDELTTHPLNARQGDIGALCESYRASGFYGTIIVQKSSNTIIAGNHRYLAAKEVGFKKIPVAYVDVDDDRALAMMVGDNRVGDLATNDDNMLLDLLNRLNASDVGLAGTGYDADDLDALVQTLNSDFKPSNEIPPRLDTKNPITCPSCGEQFVNQ